MDNSDEADKKMIKAKSYVGASSVKKSEPSKRKSFNVNEAVKSLDIALVRLKKSKLVNGECITATSPPRSPLRRPHADMFMDVSSDSTFCPPTVDNASVMSMNFSHYELVRNLSDPQCNEEDSNSNNTSNTCCLDNADINVKNEHLERYFRSVEMWANRYRDAVGPSHLLLPEK